MSNKIVFDIELCKSCKLCIQVCPKKIIIIDEKTTNNRGYAPPIVKEIDKCIACGFCARICPDSVITVEKQLLEGV